MSKYTANLLLASLIKSIFTIDLFTPSSDPKYKKGIYKGATNRLNFIDDMMEPLKKRLLKSLKKQDIQDNQKKDKDKSLDKIDIETLIKLVGRR